MFKNRYDGRRIKSLEPIQMIMPYVMKTRTDSMNMYEDAIPCEVFDDYIKEKAEQGITLDYMQIFIAAIVRMFALRPKLNRFVINGRIYARPKIWVSFAIHHDLSGNQDETTIKLCFEGTETILEVADKIQAAILKETTQHKESNSTDKLAKLLINGTVYTVEDRGTPYGHVDIFFDSHSAALSFGRQYADVYQINY